MDYSASQPAYVLVTSQLEVYFSKASKYINAEVTSSQDVCLIDKFVTTPYHLYRLYPMTRQGQGRSNILFEVTLKGVKEMVREEFARRNNHSHALRILSFMKHEPN